MQVQAALQLQFRRIWPWNTQYYNGKNKSESFQTAAEIFAIKRPFCCTFMCVIIPLKRSQISCYCRERIRFQLANVYADFERGLQSSSMEHKCDSASHASHIAISPPPSPHLNLHPPQGSREGQLFCSHGNSGRRVFGTVQNWGFPNVTCLRCEAGG